MNGRSDGRYRGKLQLRPGLSGGVTVVNVVEIEDYLRGVVPNEMPASWAKAALRAQAVAARGYALTVDVGSAIFDPLSGRSLTGLYRPRRRAPRDRQRGGGDRRPGRAIPGRARADLLLLDLRRADESSENSFYGPAIPYLRSVEDPHDDVSPYHRWTRTFSQSAIASRLSGLFAGEFERVEVLDAVTRRESSLRGFTARTATRP